MILKKVVLYASGVAAVIAAASVCVVALAFALHAALAPHIGPAWASASVAGAALLLIAILALALLALAKGPHVKAEDRDPVNRLIDFARDKPWIAAGAIAAAAAVILRNPKITAAILSAAMAGRATKKK